MESPRLPVTFEIAAVAALLRNDIATNLFFVGMLNVCISACRG